MKKTHTKSADKDASLTRTEPEYGGQDFEQGRGGSQSGHGLDEASSFSQFHNAGRGGFAAEKSANSVNEEKENKK